MGLLLQLYWAFHARIRHPQIAPHCAILSGGVIVRLRKLVSSVHVSDGETGLSPHDPDAVFETRF